MGWRPIVSSDLTPIQQSLATDSADYTHYEMRDLVLGVILEVYPPDVESNRSAHQRQDRRGYLVEAKVLCVGTGTAANLILDHVIVTQPFNTGLDDYFEHSPRASSNRVDGETLNSAGANVDPYDLDGDWCIVGFLGGSLDQPFILSWWPHPKNSLDAGTSGEGNPNRDGEGQALNQDGRYFHRVNGVEFVVTKTGDVYLSTNYANSTLQFRSDQSPTKGRWTRSTNEEEGGSILVELKPSQTLELAWDVPVDGFGASRSPDAQLPQTNPRPVEATDSTSREKTHIKVSDTEFKVTVPDEVTVISRTRITLMAEDQTTLQADNVLTLESSSILLGENAESDQGVVRGKDLHTWLSTMTVLTAMGPASINPADLATFITDTVSTKTKVE